MTNFLAPLEFDSPAAAARFAHRHACALCRVALVANGTGVNCPHCGPAYRHNIVKRGKMEKIQSEEHVYAVELAVDQNKGKQTPAEILNELGY